MRQRVQCWNGHTSGRRGRDVGREEGGKGEADEVREKRREGVGRKRKRERKTRVRPTEKE